MRCFRLVQQSLESDHSVFGLTVTAINYMYVDVHAALSAATVVPVILLTALPGSVNFALSIIYIYRKRLRIGKILLQRTRPIQSVCGLPYLDYWENLRLLLHLRPSLQMTTNECYRPNWTNYVRLQLLRHLRHFVPTDAVFNNFRLITDTELRKLLTTCNLKSCELDPLPPFVMVDVLDEIVPFLLYLFNRSLSEGFLPSSQKCSIIFPALKQSSLDPSLCQNYHPIANLSFLSKTLERLVSLQLLPYLEQSGLLPSMQSGFRAHHSMKLLSFRCFLIFTLLWINLMLLSLLYSLLRRRLIWWIMKYYYNVLRLPLAFLALLLIGFARTYLIALRWWYWVTHALLGFLSNLASLMALFWALSSTSYSQLIFLVYLTNTLPLATSMLTTSRLMSMVLLLNSLILLHLLHLLLQILILRCLLIVCHLILPRPN